MSKGLTTSKIQEEDLDKELAAEFYHKQAREDLRSKRFQKAMKCYEQAMKLDPSKVSYIHDYGIICFKSKKPEKAEEYLRKAISLDPSNDLYVYNLGILHYNLKNYTKATACLRESIKLNPTNASYLKDLGKLYDLCNNFRQAEDCYKKSIELNPTNSSYLNNLGCLYYKHKLFEKAETHFLKAVEYAPTNPKYLYDLALVSYSLGEFTDATKHFIKVLELDPQNIPCERYLMELADKYFWSGQFREAIKPLEALAKNGLSKATKYLKSAYGNLAMSLLDQEKFEQVVNLLETEKPSWLKLDSDQDALLLEAQQKLSKLQKTLIAKEEDDDVDSDFYSASSYMSKLSIVIPPDDADAWVDSVTECTPITGSVSIKFQ